MNVYEKVESLVRELINAIGEDVAREGLRDTPKRVAKMLLDELLAGYRMDPKQFVKTFDLDGVANEGLVVINDIPVKSVCEHHLLPIIGYAHIAYIPQGRVLGLSKFARIVDAFSRRLQIQERLTNQIADFIYEELKPRGVLVVIEALHLCALIRGIEEPLHMVTTAYRGAFTEDPALRREALNVICTRLRSSPLLELKTMIVP